ncbi:MAG: FAD-dependent oxidoreductase [Bdellovibrionales bacterium]|nr:FAD-dependent oxidoreductase [Bdellovibrionales bacterium]
MRILILGAGISGHTAALLLKRKLGKKHDVTVITPNSKWNWIPSNVWVGINDMTADEVTFELAPIYKRVGINYIQAKATEIFPEGLNGGSPFVRSESTHPTTLGKIEETPYDFLINATGPRLNFQATPGLGPEQYTHSVCTVNHAEDTAASLTKLIEEMKNGESKTIVVGTGHGTCTCQGAAFEYLFNLEFELREKGVRDKARVIYLSNEADLGDFGVGGLELNTGGFITPSKTFAESLFTERNIDWITGAHVSKIEKNKIHYETLDGQLHELDYSFAMLLPPFTGVPLKVYDSQNQDITSTLMTPAGFMKVDADYNPKPYEEWQADDWPKTYQTKYKNIFAIGIAFAPPHQISKPRKNANGTVITPAPPRTGMPSAIMGRIVANSITDMIKNNTQVPAYTASMAEIGAACVASAGANAFRGSAAAMTMYPIIPNYQKYPQSGRSLTHTSGELGTAGHWIKKLLHYAFIYKAKALPFWWIIPE